MFRGVYSILKRTWFPILMTVVLSAVMAEKPSSVAAQNRMTSDYLLKVGDTIVKRILPKPVSDSIYANTDYSDIHFRLNKAELDISYLDNGLTLLRLDHVIDSLGVENIAAIEIVSQSSPEGSLDRNTWLTENRSRVIVNYMNRVFPELKNKISLNKIVESWDNLASYVEMDPNMEQETIDRVLEIIESQKYSIATKKHQMQFTLGNDPNVGDVYAYLTKYYYPVIRNSGIYILHMIKPRTPINQEPEGLNITDVPSSFNENIDSIPISQPPVITRKRPLLAVKTNLVYDGFFTKDFGWAPIYNVELELYPTEHGRWTTLLEYEFPWHCDDYRHLYLQILNLQFEARRYFKKQSRHSGHYLSGYLGANLYDICFDQKAGHGYQGEGFGFGLGYGYVLPLGRRPDTRWKLEFFLKGGFYMTFYDPYDAGSPFAGKYYYDWYLDPKLFIRRNQVLRWTGPTGAGITISYDLLNKTVKNK